MKKFLIELVIAIFIGLFVWLLLSKVNPNTQNDVIKTDTVIVIHNDTIYKHSYTPKYIPVERYQIDTVSDTIQIVKDYKEVRVYLDTIHDTSFVVYLRDTITHNQIVSRTYTGNSFQTTKYITKTITEPSKIKFGIGASMIFENQKYNPGIYGCVNYKYIGGGISVNYNALSMNLYYNLK